MQAKSFQGTTEYIAQAELLEIVNVAIALQKPLLIRGEPGTGKTLLAHAIAQSQDMELISWQIKSTSKAQEGLYQYDTVQRLNDSRFGSGDVADISNYIKLGPLGKAFKSEKRCVVLIDEIDKADIEFPNDLLHELDAMSFRVHETGELIETKERPIVIITSNAEKELPDPFLRRCIFHYINFPDYDQMESIVKVHHPDIEKKLLKQCLTKFYWLREQQGLQKKPSTSEFIDWVAALRRAGVSTKDIEKEIPFLGVLVKKESDIDSLKNPRRSRHTYL